MANIALNFKKITPAAYAALALKPLGTFYLITNDDGATGELAVGTKKITNAEDLQAAITRIATAEGKITALEGKVDTLEGDENTDGSVRELLATAVTGIYNLIGEVPSETTVVDLINDGGEAVEALSSKIGTVADGHTVMGDIAANASAISSNASAIAVLNGNAQTAGSVEKIVRDAIAAVIASAPENLDTLKEISDWISSHASDAAAMNTSIAANATAIASANSAIASANLAITSNASAIAANASAISAHEAFVGSLPAGVSSTTTTIIGYVQESFQKCDTKIGTIPSAASVSTVVEYVDKVVNTHQLYWTED